MSEPVITNAEQLKFRQKVWVKAWWTHPEGEIVPCEVIGIRIDEPDRLTVQSFGRNRHTRYIKISDITAFE